MSVAQLLCLPTPKPYPSIARAHGCSASSSTYLDALPFHPISTRPRQRYIAPHFQTASGVLSESLPYSVVGLHRLFLPHSALEDAARNQTCTPQDTRPAGLDRYEIDRRRESRMVAARYLLLAQSIGRN